MSKSWINKATRQGLPIYCEELEERRDLAAARISESAEPTTGVIEEVTDIARCTKALSRSPRSSSP
jgi:hypothetical protein